MTARQLCLPFALVLVAAMAPTASAKEVTKATVCGAGECVTFTKGDHDDLPALGQGVVETDPPNAAPFYRAKVTFDGREEGGELFTFSTVYVPSAKLLRMRGERGGYVWLTTNAATRGMFETATTGLKPFPASSLGGLTERERVQAHVSETVLPPRQPPVAAADAGAPWGWIAGAGGAALILLVTTWRTVRRRRFGVCEIAQPNPRFRVGSPD